MSPIPRHLDLIVQKLQEKLTGKEEVVFESNEVNQDDLYLISAKRTVIPPLYYTVSHL
jgi:hypothetical protein